MALLLLFIPTLVSRFEGVFFRNGIGILSVFSRTVLNLIREWGRTRRGSYFSRSFQRPTHTRLRHLKMRFCMGGKVSDLVEVKLRSV